MIPLGILGASNPRAGGGVDPEPIAASILGKLTAWWEMDEASGVRNDSVGDLHFSTVVSEVSTAAGVRGASDPAASFQQPNGHIYAPYQEEASAPPGGGDHCLFGWFWVESNSGSQALMSKWNAVNAGALEYYARVENGNVHFLNGGSAYRVASVPAPDAGAWHFFVGWRDSADGIPRVQCNGGVIGSAPAASNPSPNTTSLCAATSNGSGSNKLNGRLQRWGWIKGGILSPAEREYLYNNGRGRTYAELLAQSG